ncbi:hypothetical protein EMIT0111MI5_140080 [Burkholderia sp. IT-111MI5]
MGPDGRRVASRVVRQWKKQHGQRSVTIQESRYNTGFAELTDNLRGEAGWREARCPVLVIR